MNDSAAPPGYSTVSPYLSVKDVTAAIRFQVEVFDGIEVERIVREDGSVGHAEVRIGSSLIMLGASADDAEARQAALYVYVADVDAVHARALRLGARSHRDPADQFYGDRVGAVIDPGGTLWWIATNRERLSHAEIQARADRRARDSGS